MGTNAFAEACGMSSQSMAQFLRSKSLTTATIYRMATALDIDPRDMFFPIEEIDNSNLCDKKSETENDKKEHKEGQNTAGEMFYCPRCGTKFFVVKNTKAE